jgi:disulfide oxidoreductase YuzD
MAFKKTTNYKMFKYMKGNRSVNPEHVSRLVRAIKDRNLLSEFPVMVDSKNYVIDGQHRIKAAQSLKLPVYYRKVEETGISVYDVAKFNTAHKTWNYVDIMNSYADQGKKDYQVLKDFMGRTGLTVTASLVLLSASDENKNVLAGGTILRKTKFREGEFKVVDLKGAEQKAGMLSDLSALSPYYHERAFVQAALIMFNTTGYDHERMKKQMEVAGRIEYKYNDVTAYLRKFEAVYNRHMSKSKLRFF